MNFNEDTAGVAEVDIGDQTPSAIDSVFTDAETRLFAVRGIVCVFPPGTLLALEIENPVSLLDSEGNPIGSARVFIEGGMLMADALFQYGCPERLSIETGQKHYFHPEMVQEFYHLTSDEAEQFRSKTLPMIISNVLPLSSTPPEFRKRIPLVIIMVNQLILSPDKRLDSYIPPVVPLSEEESP